MLSLSLQSTSLKSASSMKRNCHTCEMILRITRSLIYYFNYCLTLQNDVQFFKKYLRKENSAVNEYTDICKYFQTDLWHEMITMNDIDVSDFKQSTEENVEASDDQKHFRNSIAWISLDLKRFINSSCTFSFIKVDNYDEMNDTKRWSINKSLKQYIRLIRIILNYSKLEQNLWSSLDDSLQSEWLFFLNEKDFSLAQWFLNAKVSNEDINQYFKISFQKTHHADCIFKNADQFRSILHNISHEISDDSWFETSLKISSMNSEIKTDIFKIQYRNVINVLKFLLRHCSFASNLKYASIKVYNINENQMYMKMHIDIWWWNTQALISEDNTIVSVLLATDKIMLTQHHENKFAWSVYIIVDNLNQATWWKQNKSSVILLKFISSTKHANEDLKRELYHRSLKIILKREFKLFNWMKSFSC